jgi:tetratricopeptide (TPR) repeat protein
LNLMTNTVQECLSELKYRALVAQMEGRLADAESLWGVLFRSTRDAAGPLDPELPRILLLTAETAMQRRNWAAACEYADRALHLLDAIADHGRAPVDREARLKGLSLYATACRLQDRLQDAELTLQIALMEAEQSLGEDHADVAAAWRELALVYIAMNQPEEADRVWKRAMEAAARAQITGQDWPAYCAVNPAA